MTVVKFERREQNDQNQEGFPFEYRKRRVQPGGKAEPHPTDVRMMMVLSPCPPIWEIVEQSIREKHPQAKSGRGLLKIVDEGDSYRLSIEFEC